MKEEEIKKVVREGYAEIARQSSSCCAPSCCGGDTGAPSCCGGDTAAEAASKAVGYTDEDLRTVPEGSNLGLGCGNPVALASLKKGETVVDLGSGAGFDCFLAAQRVGESGRVIGVDMTPDMLEKARKNASGFGNVEFRLGEIENLPVADGTADAIISNCVINLSPDKARVFSEAFRVLKPGGRLMISDIVLTKELPGFIMNSIEAYIGCVSGAVLKDEYLKMIADAGFGEVSVVEETQFPVENIINDPTVKAIIKDMDISQEKATEIAGTVLSIKVEGIKK